MWVDRSNEPVRPTLSPGPLAVPALPRFLSGNVGRVKDSI
jgi:hypothetical protein